MDMARPRQVAP